MAKKLANLSDAVVSFLPYAEAATYPSIWKSFQQVLRFYLKSYKHVLVVLNDHYASLAFSVSNDLRCIYIFLDQASNLQSQRFFL
jgi:hypothetical protein